MSLVLLCSLVCLTMSAVTAPVEGKLVVSMMPLKGFHSTQPLLRPVRIPNHGSFNKTSCFTIHWNSPSLQLWTIPRFHFRAIAWIQYLTPARRDSFCVVVFCCDLNWVAGSADIRYSAAHLVQPPSNSSPQSWPYGLLRAHLPVNSPI